jgi:hypothetical protein
LSPPRRIRDPSSPTQRSSFILTGKKLAAGKPCRPFSFQYDCFLWCGSFNDSFPVFCGKREGWYPARGLSVSRI